MALTTTEFDRIFGRDLTIDTDITNTASKNIRNRPCTLYNGVITNIDPGHAYASVKFYDHDGDGWVGGTTQPVMVLPVTDNGHQDFEIVEGWAFTAALTIAGAVEDGTVTTTAPAGDLVGRLVTA